MFKHRIFIAIQIPETLKNTLDDYLKSLANNRLVRRTKKENIHITVSFLGYLSAEEIEILKNIVKEEAGKNNPFELRPGKIIWAPHNAAKRMIWLEFEKSPEFEKLKNGIENKILLYQKQKYFQNFKKEQRENHIHLTLARFEPKIFQSIKDAIPPQGIYLKKNGPFKAESLDIMESRLSRLGAEYELISSFKLHFQKK